MDTPASTVTAVTERVCSNCVNVALADSGLFCMEYREMVEENVARRCESFDPTQPMPPVSVTLRHPARAHETNGFNARSAESGDQIAGPQLHVVDAPTTWTDNSGHVHQLQPPPNARSDETADQLEGPTEAVIAACAAHLASLHIASWGQNFSIFDAEGQRKAAEWLAEHIAAVVSALPPSTHLTEPKGSPCATPPSESGGTAATASSPTRP